MTLICPPLGYFYPRPPRGGRRFHLCYGYHSAGFLSTPSARRATAGGCGKALSRKGFLSTPSARRATWIVQIVFNFTKFLSTPSARRATSTHLPVDDRGDDFYPRPPRGGRHLVKERQRFNKEFLSTPSARRATDEAVRWLSKVQISIHALREEGDVSSTTHGMACCRFLSTPSARRATS